MGTFANLVSINATTQGRYAGPPAVAIINAKATAITLANRLQPLGVTSTNLNVVMLGEGVSHFGVRARVGTGTITTMPSVNIYRLYGPAEEFASTTIANDGTVEFDVVNHSQAYSLSAASNTYKETIQAFAFTGAVATAAVTDSTRNGSYYYSDWAVGDRSSYVALDAGGTLYASADRSWLIPSYGARAILVFQSVAANVSSTCDVLVYPFAKGNSA
jgi:hypothetical protein